MSNTRSNGRRQRILDASAELIARHGFDGVTVADLAEAVGVTAPALYRHFSNKKAIFEAIGAEVVDRLARELQSSKSPEGLTSVVRSLVGTVLDRPNYVLAYLRERHRLWNRTDLLDEAELKLFSSLVDLIGQVAAVEESAARLRLVGAIGILRGVAERSASFDPRKAELIAEHILGMLTAHPSPHPPTQAQTPAAWSFEPSPADRILAAALPLFRKRGFDGVGIGEIGDAAGVGASNVYRYFDTKQEILTDLYDRVGARVQVALEDALLDAPEAETVLDRMIHDYCRIAFDAVDLVVVVSQNRGALAGAEVPRLRRRDHRALDQWRAVVSATRPDRRRWEIATIVGCILPMINIYPQFLSADLPTPDAVAPLVRAYVGWSG